MERRDLMLIHTGDPPVHVADGSGPLPPQPIVEQAAPDRPDIDHPAMDHAAVMDLLAEERGLFWRGLVIACAVAVPLWSLLIFGIYQLF